jgi:hypothetical protein
VAAARQARPGLAPPAPHHLPAYFADNTIDTGTWWDLIPSGETYAGGAPCSIPTGNERLHTAGNKS